MKILENGMIETNTGAIRKTPQSCNECVLRPDCKKDKTKCRASGVYRGRETLNARAKAALVDDDVKKAMEAFDA